MSEQDALIELDLDMSKVETKLAQLDKTFASLGNTNRSWFRGINDALIVLTANLQATETAFSSFASNLQRTTGMTLSDAKNLVDYSQNTKKLADSELQASKALETRARADAVRARASILTARALRDEARANEILAEAENKRPSGGARRPLGPDLSGSQRTKYIGEQIALQTRMGREIAATAAENERYYASLTKAAERNQKVALESLSTKQRERAAIEENAQAELASLARIANERQKAALASLSAKEKERELTRIAAQEESERITRVSEMRQQQALATLSAKQQEKQAALEAAQAEIEAINRIGEARQQQALASLQAKERERQMAQDQRISDAQALSLLTEQRTATARASLAAKEQSCLNGLPIQGPDLDGSARDFYSANTGSGRRLSRAAKDAEDAATQKMNEIRDYFQQVARDIHDAGGIGKFTGPMGGGLVGAGAGLDGAGLEKEIAQAREFGVIMQSIPTVWDKVFAKAQTHLIQLPIMLLEYQAINAAIQAITETWDLMIKSSSEFQKQSIFFKEGQRAARSMGEHPDNAGPDDLLKSSIMLATRYGDEVNDVSQDINQWYKATGNLNASVFMTNEALKFQLATGTQIEDFYKTLTALSNQAADMPMHKGDKTGFDLGQTPELMKTITALSFAMGAGFEQVDKKGTEMGGHLNNSAVLLLQAMDKDTGALKTLGYSVEQAAMMNAALIRAFGNTGAAAGEAGEKIGRIAGGLASLSKPGALKLFQKAGFDVKELSSALDTHKDVLEELSKEYEHLSIPQKNIFSTTIAGTRQYEALAAVIEGYAHNLDKVKKAMQDKGVEDRLAEQMAGTFEVGTRKLSAAWEGFIVRIGNGVIPVLTSLVNFVSNTVIPVIGTLGSMLSDSMQDTGDWFRRQGNNIAISQDRYKLENGYKTPEERKALQNDLAQRIAQNHAFDRNFESRNPQQGKYAADFDRWGTGVFGNGGREHWADGSGKTRSEYIKAHGNDKGWKPRYPTKAYYRHPEYLHGTVGAEATSEMVTDMSGGDFSSYIAAAMGQYKFPPGDNSTNQGTILGPGGAGAGAPKDYQIYGDSLRNLTSDYQDLDDKKKSYIAQMDDEVDKATRNIRINGLSEASQKQLLKATLMKNSAIQEEIDTNTKWIGQFKSAASAANAHAAAAGKGTAGWAGWTAVARDAERQARSLENAQRSLHREQRNNMDTVDESAQRLKARNYSTLDSANQAQLKSDLGDYRAATGFSARRNDLEKYKSDLDKQFEEQKAEIIKDFTGDTNDPGTSRGQQYAGLVNSYNSGIDTYNSNDKSETEALRRFKEDIAKSTSDEADKGLNSLVGIAGYKKSDETYIKSMLSLEKEATSVQKQYQDDLQKADSPELKAQVEDWHNAALGAMSAEKAVADFNKRVEEIQASAIYKGVEAAFSEITKDISSAVSGLITYSAAEDKHIRQYQQEIDLINEKKYAEDLSYASMTYHTATQTAIHEIQMQHYDQEIQKLRDMQKAQEDARNRPNVIKKVAEAFSKSVIDTLLQQMTQGAMKKLFHLDDGSKQLQTALNKHVNTITSTLAPSLSKFDTSADRLAKSLDHFSQSQSSGKGGVGGSGGGGLGGGLFGGLGNIFASQAQPGTAWAGDAAGDGTGGYGNPGGAGYDMMGGLPVSSATGPIQADDMSNLMINANNSSGIGGWLQQNGQNMADGMAYLATAYQGYQQGGVGGGVQTAASVFEMTGNPYLAIGAGLISAFSGGRNTTPQNNPDIYYTSEIGQGLADVAGAQYNANGQGFLPNAQLMKTLGGKGEEQYITDFIKQHPDIAAQVLTPQEMALFTNANGITYGKAGDVSLNNGQHEQWNQLIQDAQDATSAIQKYQDALNQGMQQTLVAVNMYGATVGAFPMIWNQPGYDWPTAPSANAPGYGGTNPYTNVTPTSGSGGGGGNTTVIVNTSVDGKPLARNYQAYMLRSQAAGYSRIS